MFKIILFMHGKLAEEFIRASALVFGEQKEMEAYGPVSYTHLDVYKRQVYIQCLPLCPFRRHNLRFPERI